MTSAQGQLMTRKVSARLTQTPHWPVNRLGRMASAAAPMQTAGV